MNATSQKLTQAEVLATAKAYALAQYTQGGDIIVECMEDAELLHACGAACTKVGVEAKVRTLIKQEARWEAARVEAWSF